MSINILTLRNVDRIKDTHHLHRLYLVFLSWLLFVSLAFSLYLLFSFIYFSYSTSYFYIYFLQHLNLPSLPSFSNLYLSSLFSFPFFSLFIWFSLRLPLFSNLYFLSLFSFLFLLNLIFASFTFIFSSLYLSPLSSFLFITSLFDFLPNLSFFFSTCIPHPHFISFYFFFIWFFNLIYSFFQPVSLTLIFFPFFT